jgi:hypothetical protein
VFNQFRAYRDKKVVGVFIAFFIASIIFSKQDWENNQLTKAKSNLLVFTKWRL